MPEGDAVHKLANTFEEIFVGHQCAVSSPQGRFSSSAELLDGWVLAGARAVGKHMFLGFLPPSSYSDKRTEGHCEEEIDHWVHIHLGLYGWWRFNGDASVLNAGHDVLHRVGPKDTHRPERWGTGPLNPPSGGSSALTTTTAPPEAPSPYPEAHPSSVTTSETLEWEAPEPIGQVRLRILTAHAVADLAGPNRCELIGDADRCAVEARLGPDPLAQGARTDPLARQRFIDNIRSRRRAVGELIMDQSLIAGVGNIYRADALFLAGISPMRRGDRLSATRVGHLWDVICRLMTRALEAGYLVTMDPDEAPDPPLDTDPEASRWYVYHRSGRPCLRCGTTIAEKNMQQRRLFWCPTCQR